LDLKLRVDLEIFTKEYLQFCFYFFKVFFNFFKVALGSAPGSALFFISYSSCKEFLNTKMAVKQSLCFIFNFVLRTIVFFWKVGNISGNLESFPGMSDFPNIFESIIGV